MVSFTFYVLRFNVSAVELQSPRFKLEIENLKVDLEKETSSTYSLEQTLGTQAFNEYKTKGYAIKSETLDKTFTFSLSQSLVNLNEAADFSVNSNRDYQVDLIQEYALKSNAGEIIAKAPLEYSLASDFRPLPNQNKGDLPVLILLKDTNKAKIRYKLNASAAKPEGTYETIVDFTALPSY